MVTGLGASNRLWGSQPTTACLPSGPARAGASADCDTAVSSPAPAQLAGSLGLCSQCPASFWNSWPAPAQPWGLRLHLSLQVQLAETEAFSLNSDRSSSILLGDDLSLEDPTACLPGIKDNKVSGPRGLLGQWVCAGCPRPPSQDTASSQHTTEVHRLCAGPSSLVGQMRALGLRDVA